MDLNKTTPRPWALRISDSRSLITIARRKAEGEKGYAQKQIAMLIGGGAESTLDDAELIVHSVNLIDRLHTLLTSAPADDEEARRLQWLMERLGLV
jgi:hypothetical protein